MPPRVLVTYTERDGAVRTLDCDAVIREGWDCDSEVTENPIERGAEVIDHVREKNDSLTLEITITNTPIRVPQSHMGGVTGSVTKDSQSGATVLVFGAEFDRVRTVADDLVRVKAAGLLWYIQTALHNYDEFLLQNFKVAKDAKTGNSATFILTLKRARFVETSDVSVPRTRRAAPRAQSGNTPPTRPPESIFHRTTGGLGSDVGAMLRQLRF